MLNKTAVCVSRYSSSINTIEVIVLEYCFLHEAQYCSADESINSKNYKKIVLRTWAEAGTLGFGGLSFVSLGLGGTTG